MRITARSFDLPGRRLLTVLGLIGAVLTVGCDDKEPRSSDADPSHDAGGSEQWIVGGWITTQDTYTGFLTVANDLSANGSIDPSKVKEFPGDFVYASAGGGVVFVGQEAKPTLERWKLANGELTKDGEINLSNFGVTETLGGGRNVIQFVDAERAFYFDNENLQVVVFNPTRLETVEAFSLKGLEQAGQELALNFVRRDGDRFIITARYWSLADETPTSLVRAAIVDATTKAVTYIDDTRCGNIAFQATDTAGNLYLGSHPAQAVNITAGTAGANATPPCLLRINKGASEFDKSYFVNLAELSGGVAGGLLQGADGNAYLFTYTGGPITAENERSVLRGEEWALYNIKLGDEKNTYAKVEGIGAVTPYGDAFTTTVGGKITPFVIGVNADFSEGSYYEISDPKNAKKALHFPGFPGHAHAVR